MTQKRFVTYLTPDQDAVALARELLAADLANDGPTMQYRGRKLARALIEADERQRAAVPADVAKLCAEAREHAAILRSTVTNSRRHRRAILLDRLAAALESHAFELACTKAQRSMAETCKENRAEGRGPCGACAICCGELRAALEVAAPATAKEE